MPTPSIGTDGFSPSEANRSALLFPRPTWMLPQAQLLMFMEQLQQLFLNFRWPMWTPPHGSWPPVAMQPVYGAPLTNPPVPQAMYGAPYVGRPPFTMQPVYGAPLTNPPVPQAMYGAPSVGGAWPRDGAV